MVTSAHNGINRPAFAGWNPLATAQSRVAKRVHSRHHFHLAGIKSIKVSFSADAYSLKQLISDWIFLPVFVIEVPPLGFVHSKTF